MRDGGSEINTPVVVGTAGGSLLAAGGSRVDDGGGGGDSISDMVGGSSPAMPFQETGSSNRVIECGLPNVQDCNEGQRTKIWAAFILNTPHPPDVCEVNLMTVCDTMAYKAE
jgi:hypothetical protein